MIRRVVLVLHRWFGLLAAVFLVFVSLTGSVLVFSDELERLVAPQLFARPQPGVPHLDLATLVERASILAPPRTQILGVQVDADDQAKLVLLPEINPRTGQPDVKSLVEFPPEIFLDPWTGAELGRRRFADLSEGIINLRPFILFAHQQLVPMTMMMPLGVAGSLLLGVLAIIWTLDCFVGFYLTLPVSFRGFWRQWTPAWLIKRDGGTYRLNLDLHRAFSLWLWPVLFVFAWSSVMLNMRPVYNPVMHSLFAYDTQGASPMNRRSPKPHPALDWRHALGVGERLMAERLTTRGISDGEATDFIYNPMAGIYVYTVSLGLAGEAGGQAASVMFDGDTGELSFVSAGPGDHVGNRITVWLRLLHRAKVSGAFYWPYRLFVFVLGFVITMLSVTGVYIWWKKRSVRKGRATPAVAIAEGVS
ncbi:MAG: PepSY-associated TM helix domain-containing protein [Vicinamibacterales bacterium]